MSECRHRIATTAGRYGSGGAQPAPITGPKRLILVAVLGSVPFLNKAIHVDDTNYLGVAVRILEDPFDPFGGSPVWSDGEWFYSGCGYDHGSVFR